MINQTSVHSTFAFECEMNIAYINSITSELNYNKLLGGITEPAMENVAVNKLKQFWNAVKELLRNISKAIMDIIRKLKMDKSSMYNSNIVNSIYLKLQDDNILSTINDLIDNNYLGDGSDYEELKTKIEDIKAFEQQVIKEVSKVNPKFIKEEYSDKCTAILDTISSTVDDIRRTIVQFEQKQKEEATAEQVKCIAECITYLNTYVSVMVRCINYSKLSSKTKYGVKTDMTMNDVKINYKPKFE